jgi:hypothetical protein
MTKRWVRSILVTVFLTGTACSSGRDALDLSANGVAADAARAAGQCSWPADLDDPAPHACRAMRAFVSCGDPAGGGCGCLSDDPTTCSGCGSGFTCQNQCAANQYGVACGGIGPSSPSSNQTPPDGCTVRLSTPAGVSFYCCPCS